MSIDLIIKYFPEITETQKTQFEKLETLYKDWNDKINVISRNDIDEFYERHVLHSLGTVSYTHLDVYKRQGIFCAAYKSEHSKLQKYDLANIEVSYFSDLELSNIQQYFI